MGVQNWLQLTLTEGLGPILSQRLITACGGADAACGATVQTLRSIEGIGSAKASKIRAAMDRAVEEVPREVERVQAIGAAICCPDDADYPLLLKEIPDPPGVLYVRGALQPRDLHGVAIVGSRKCSFYGREQAERFGALLGGAALTVISGGARGIDSAAHRGALSHPSGRTIAVLGCGVDVVYPPENTALFQQIVERGALISEYPMGTPPRAENFPRRNRIVSGMSRGVLVIEAAERSGALITARQACDDHGRPVFAVPGRVDNELSVGPHQLIRDGAVLTTCLDDILANLMPLPDTARVVADATTALPAPSEDPAPPLFPVIEPRRAATPTLSERQSSIVSTLDREPVSTDTIIDRCGLPASVVLQELTLLTLKGVVRRSDAGFARS